MYDLDEYILNSEAGRITHNRTAACFAITGTGLRLLNPQILDHSEIPQITAGAERLRQGRKHDPSITFVWAKGTVRRA